MVLAPPIDLRATRPDPRQVQKACNIHAYLEQTKLYMDPANSRHHSIDALTMAQRQQAIDYLTSQAHFYAIQYCGAERYKRPHDLTDRQLDSRIERRLRHPEKWIERTPLYVALASPGSFQPHPTEPEPEPKVRREWQHGKSGYDKHQCRCDICKRGNAEANYKLKLERIARLAADHNVVEHGKPSTYTNWNCRCTPCKSAYKASRKPKKES